MALIECKLCRRIYNGFEGQRVCGECIRRLEEIYGHVHEYMRDNQDRDFDLETLADEMENNGKVESGCCPDDSPCREIIKNVESADGVFVISCV